MFEQLGLDAQELAEIKAYATIEPVGEGMADYGATDRKKPPAVDPAKRRALLKAILPPAPKKEK